MKKLLCENSASLRSTILVAMHKSPPKNQILICAIQFYGSWHGFRDKEGLPYLKIMLFLTTGAGTHMFPYPSSSSFHFPFLHNGGVCTSKSNVCFFSCRFQANRVGCACFCCSFKASKYLFDWAWHHDFCAKILHRK